MINRYKKFINEKILIVKISNNWKYLIIKNMIKKCNEIYD